MYMYTEQSMPYKLAAEHLLESPNRNLHARQYLKTLWLDPLSHVYTFTLEPIWASFTMGCCRL